MITPEANVALQATKEIKDLIPLLDKLHIDPTDIRTVVDTAFVLRECAEQLDEVRKKMDKVREGLEQTVCFYCATCQFDNIKTELCTATPKSDIEIKFPTKKGNPGWEEFMQKMGASEFIISNELCRPHYPAVAKYVTAFVEQEGKLPFDLSCADIAAVKNKVTMRKKVSLF